MPNEHHDEGIPAALKRSVEIILRTLQNRAELFGLELEEEGRWVVSALIWTAAAIFFAVLAVTLFTITVVMLVPESYRGWTLGGFFVLYLFMAVSAFSGVKKHFKAKRPPLSDTVNELKKDLDWIQSRD